jgi:long-subunit acyl-CoA synthetase (AMP-forming)
MLGNQEYHAPDIKQLLECSVKKYGERPAFWVQKYGEAVHGAITYREAYEDVCALGTLLIAKDLNGKGIAIAGENSYEWAVSFLAAICVGAAVPLDTGFWIVSLKHFLNITDCRCAIFSEELQDTYWQIRNDGVTGVETLINMDRKKGEWDLFTLREMIEDGREMMASGNRDFVEAQITQNEICAMIFTSDRKGDYKAASLTHGNIAAEIRQLSETLNITSGDVFFSKLPFHNAHECICGILLPLISGAAIVCDEEFGYNVDVSTLQGYGLAESASLVALDTGNGLRVLSGMKARIDSPDPETGIGEICLTGENIMAEYRKDPEATAKVLRDGWLFTGDMGRMEDGTLYISGGKWNAIIAENGQKVYPEELENRLNTIPYVRESLVWGNEPDTGTIPVITATLLLDDETMTEKLGAGFSEQDVFELLWREVKKINEELPEFKRIKRIVPRKDAFLKDSSQRIIRWEFSNAPAPGTYYKSK